MLHVIAGLAAKIASASTVAQVAAGVGVAVAGVTGAGAAGVLPGPVQDGVAGAIEAVTPFDVPDSADDRVTGVDDAVRHAEAPETPADETGPSVSPSEVPVVSTPVAPTTPSPTTEAEPGDDGVPQHRGGRTTTQPSDSAPRPSVTPAVDDSPEVEDHHSEGDDDAGSHGGDSGRDGSGRDDSSGHGGGDD
jgi:hypothetical protein